MKKLKAILVAALCLCIGGFTLVSCGGGDDKTITITGSSSVTPVMQKLAAAYEDSHEDITIEVTSSDSSAGVQDTVNGKNDFGMASRKLKESETGVKATQICTDGVAVIASPSASVTNVTGEELYNLYSVGAPIGSITAAITREAGSGTRDAFDDLVKNAAGDKLKSLTTLASVISEQKSTSAVKTSVAGNATQIGYISYGSLDSTVKALSFEGVAPTLETIGNGTYKLSRPFNIILPELSVEDYVQDFIDFILGVEGKAIIQAEGCVPVA